MFGRGEGERGIVLTNEIGWDALNLIFEAPNGIPCSVGLARKRINKRRHQSIIMKRFRGAERLEFLRRSIERKGSRRKKESADVVLDNWKTPQRH
jgi:hypothetical protein